MPLPACGPQGRARGLECAHLYCEHPVGIEIVLVVVVTVVVMVVVVVVTVLK